MDAAGSGLPQGRGSRLLAVPTGPDAAGLGAVLDQMTRPVGRELPAPRRGAVERSGLLERLRSDPSPIVVVSAPGGYGKSILARQWSQADPRPATWVPLDESHDDPVRLVWALLYEIGRIVPVLPELYTPLIHPAPPIEDVLLPRFAALLRQAPPLLMVLDDVHSVFSAASLRVLSFLVDTFPDESRLMVLTRRGPRVPLSRARLDGRLLELGAADLALSVAETHAVARASGWTLDADDAAAVHRRTEGWPAAVTLAALAMRSSRFGPTDIEAATGDHEILGEYLSELALAELDDEQQRFMLATCALDTMSGPLCDAALETTGSATLLESLARSNLFVIPLDSHGERYRYHHLFREWLRAQASRQDVGAGPEVLDRAAAWHEARGERAEAFEYARRAGNLQRAGRVALEAWDGYASTGQLRTVRTWVDRCSDAQIRSDAQLSLAAAWVHQMSGSPARARHYLAAATTGDLDQAPADGATTLRSSIANARSAAGAEGLTAMARDGELVIASETPQRTRWLLGGYRAVGIANLMLGRLTEADAALREALELSQAPEVAYVRVICLGFLALVGEDRADLRASVRSAEAAMRLIETRSLHHVLQAIPAHAALASIHQRAGHARRADAELAEIDRLFPLIAGIPWFSADAAIRSGRVHVLLGRDARARELADHARLALAGYPDAGALPERLVRLDAMIGASSDLSLTPAEQRLLPFLPTHLSLGEIARLTGRSRSTVKTQVASIYAKLGAGGRSEAVASLDRMGLVTTVLPTGVEPVSGGPATYRPPAATRPDRQVGQCGR